MSLNWKKATDWERRRIDGDEMATFIRDAAYERFPADVAHQAKRMLLEGNRIIDGERAEQEQGRLSVIEIKTADGNVFRTEYSHEKGEADNPLFDDELTDKFHRWAGPSFAPDKIEKIICAVFDVDQETDVGAFTESLREAFV